MVGGTRGTDFEAVRRSDSEMRAKSIEWELVNSRHTNLITNLEEGTRHLKDREYVSSRRIEEVENMITDLRDFGKVADHKSSRYIDFANTLGEDQALDIIQKIDASLKEMSKGTVDATRAARTVIEEALAKNNQRDDNLTAEDDHNPGRRGRGGSFSGEGRSEQPREFNWKPFGPPLEQFTEDMDPLDWIEWKRKARSYLGQSATSTMKATPAQALMVLAQVCSDTTLRNADIKDDNETSVEDMIQKLEGLVFEVHSKARRQRRFWFMRREQNVTIIKYLDIEPNVNKSNFIFL